MRTTPFKKPDPPTGNHGLGQWPPVGSPELPTALGSLAGPGLRPPEPARKWGFHLRTEGGELGAFPSAHWGLCLGRRPPPISGRGDCARLQLPQAPPSARVTGVGGAWTGPQCSSGRAPQDTGPAGDPASQGQAAQAHGAGLSCLPSTPRETPGCPQGPAAWKPLSASTRATLASGRWLCFASFAFYLS